MSSPRSALRLRLGVLLPAVFILAAVGMASLQANKQRGAGKPAATVRRLGDVQKES
jgi:hypothetical protein